MKNVLYFLILSVISNCFLAYFRLRVAGNSKSCINQGVNVNRMEFGEGIARLKWPHCKSYCIKLYVLLQVDADVYST